MKDKQAKDMNRPPQSTDAMITELPDISIESQPDLPENWEWAKWGEIAEINPRRSIVSSGGMEVTFLGMADVSDEGKISTPQVRTYNAVKSGFTSFAENDLLIAKITPCFENGKGALAKGLTNGVGFGSTEFHVVRAGARVLIEILFYHSLSHEFREKGEQKMTGSAGQKRVPTEFLRTYLIPLPPLDEQQRIAAILTKWDEGIKKLQAIIAKSKQRKAGLMQQLLTGTKRFTEFEEETWAMFRLGDFVIKSSEKFNCDRAKQHLPCVELEHIEQGTGTLSGQTSTEFQKSIKNIFRTGDVVFGKLRPYLKKYFKASFNGVASSETWVLRGKPNLCENDFLYYLVQSQFFIDACDKTTGW